jgi:hypothetical protein
MVHGPPAMRDSCRRVGEAFLSGVGADVAVCGVAVGDIEDRVVPRSISAKLCGPQPYVVRRASVGDSRAALVAG